ncbi:MAG: HD domain-containing protein [Armatimonadetes bacterium]|nr:HD domain-containing protein [Armatimonadota bacterium]
MEYTIADLNKAFNIAVDNFSDKVRKGDGSPYLGHLLRVTGTVMEGHGSLRAQIGALLHDVIEDVPAGREVIRAAFGDDMVALVEECSDTDEPGNKPDWKSRKLAHIDAVAGMSEDAVRITIADKLDNCRSLTTLVDYGGISFLAKFNAPAEAMVWYAESMAAALGNASVDVRGVSPQVDELKHQVEQFRDLVSDLSANA